ncbi:2Fe-2S iron-sulfur cluster-binding protein [Chelativorans sp. YIM 93263]|uniref:2Fe-2S iron-sulfur cluster-binding protein n=1 Tax=Chelativorans sp. YIM 93263 TaxID=2906648 RepID=UPI002377DBF3|nr:2Fe-2S iron-sulfur cluster-binding protein [Chelativorans sp. YIM 93263]
MAHRFSQLMFTDQVQALQVRHGSRGSYELFEEPNAPANDRLGPIEQEFLSERDSFYMASVSSSGWPYVQHRGGPKGFLKVLDAMTLGFADYSGNRQYVSTGNFVTDDRVSLIFVDYPARRRLKILGRVRVVQPDQGQDALARLQDNDYGARVERGFLIKIEAFDWNCPQHIVPRFTEEEIRARRDQEADLNEAKVTRQALSPATIGDGPLPLIITGVRQLTPRIRAYELGPLENERLPKVTAGAHLKVPVAVEGGTVWRSYSIAGTGPRHSSYEIAVLIQGEGSRAIHDIYQIGTRINCSMPQNDFSLRDDLSPVILIAGGIGITPIRTMAWELYRAGRPFQLHYSVRSRSDAAYVDELEAAFPDNLRVHESSVRRMNIQNILETGPTETRVYVCGPELLIKDVIAQVSAVGLDPARIHCERFGQQVSDGDRPFSIHIADIGATVQVAAEQTALDALLQAGFAVMSDCRSGNCGTCTTQVVAGDVDHRDSWSLSLGREKRNRQFAPCISRAAGHVLTISIPHQD